MERPGWTEVRNAAKWFHGVEKRGGYPVPLPSLSCEANGMEVWRRAIMPCLSQKQGLVSSKPRLFSCKSLSLIQKAVVQKNTVTKSLRFTLHSPVGEATNLFSKIVTLPLILNTAVFLWVRTYSHKRRPWGHFWDRWVNLKPSNRLVQHI